ncbi:MAG: hypothetical protein RJB66_2098 [Pseudomonadota bacterium]|jgi:hypothetical protein
MGIKPIGVMFFVLLMMTPALFAQVISTYYWNEEGEKVLLEPVPNYIVEFATAEPGTYQPSLTKTQKPLAERKFPGARILLLNSSAYSKAIASKTSGGWDQSSPLFKENGDIKALAGGVFVYLKPGLEISAIQSLWQKLDLKVLKRYPEEGPTKMWLIESPSGLESLNLANQLIEDHSDFVLKARPNFWQPMETRELKKLLPILPSSKLQSPQAPKIKSKKIK